VYTLFAYTFADQTTTNNNNLKKQIMTTTNLNAELNNKSTTKLYDFIRKMNLMLISDLMIKSRKIKIIFN
jgi:hypothetical protein